MIWNTLRSVVIIAIGLSLPVFAQSVLPPGTATKVLDNGLRVVVVPTDTEDVVALQIVMAVGSRNEVEEGKTGFAHFFEHLMFRGTERYPNEVAQAMLKEVGASSNAWTWDDQTVYHHQFLREDLERILDYEADRFQNLKYAEPEFRTEALAVLGEYNKNSADPTEKMFEVLQDTAFDVHTYKHTTMGFLADIENFPEGYDYSWTFYDRFYRPEYATLLLVGDVEAESTFELVERYFGSWERGDHRAVLAEEPPQTKPRQAHVDWDSETMPALMVGYKAPPFDDLEATVALQIWEDLAFSQRSDLYRELVIEEQIVDSFQPFFWLKKDPFLVGLVVRVTDESRFDEIQERVFAAFENAYKEEISTELLERVKSRTRYGFLQSLDSPASIASNFAMMLSLDPNPEVLDRYYGATAAITSEKLAEVAKKTFQPSQRTAVTLKTVEKR